MNWGRIYFGALVIAVGSLFLLDAAGALDAGETIAAWWPVALIAAGGLDLATNRSHWVVPVVLIGGGGALLLRTTEVIDTWAVVGPVLLIVIGIGIVTGIGMRARVVSDDRVNTFNVFSGSNIASHSTHFEGGSVGAVFGGAEIDLHDAALAPGAKLDVFTAFGGTEIKVPQGWNVVTHGLPIFGGFENVTATEELAADAPVLDVNATVLFGGVEVKH